MERKKDAGTPRRRGEPLRNPPGRQTELEEKKNDEDEKTILVPQEWGVEIFSIFHFFSCLQ